MKCRLLLATLLLSTSISAGAAINASSFERAPDDPAAITVKATGDGRTDDSAAIQNAIDAAAGAKGQGGIVYLPSGRYRVTRTIFVWPAVRIFGVGPTRPVILLGDATPGFQKGVDTMLMFAGARASGTAAGARHIPFSPPDSVPFDPHIADANPGTFYSALSNVDFEIGTGNPAAAAIRFHAAQHAYLSHIDFRIGSGLAGIYQGANEIEDVHFHGGRYGILTEKPSPAWQFTLIDSSFDGQREAAIREHEAGLTLVNVRLRNVPVGIDIDKGYGDWLWGKDVRFENVAKAAVVISNEGNAYTQIGFENALASRTPTFARFRDSGKTVAGVGAAYRIKAFNYGLTLAGLGVSGQFATRIDAEPLAALPAAQASAIRALPPVSEWASVRRLGAKGDGSSDDTAAIQAAIDAHRVVYFPIGRYIVTDTLRLKPDTVLIGLHPSLTQIVLPDDTQWYGGGGAPKALVASSKGGDAIVSGLGLFTGGINPRATALLWKAGADSLVDDVKIEGGHGTMLADGSRFDPYNATHSGDADSRKRWDGQYPSIWVTDGGGGSFANVWTPNTYAQAGFAVSDTKTAGHVYELSAEHHVRAEIVLNGVENWEFLAPQTEEEAGEGQDTVSLEVHRSHNILFANYHAYRVTRTIKPADAAVRLFDSGDIRFRNLHVNAESGFATCDSNGCATYLRASKFPFENAIVDVTSGLEVREREFAVLDVPAVSVAPKAASLAPVAKLADGFYSISGGAVDAAGKLYFVDHRFQRIYGWSQPEGLSIERDNVLDPVNLVFDPAGDLMVLSSDGPAGRVYSFRPGTPASAITLVAPTPMAAHATATVALPVNTWVNGEFRDQIDPATYRFPTLAEMYARDVGEAKPLGYSSPDGRLVLPAYRVLQQGPARWSDTLDSYGLVTAKPGERVFVVNGSEDRTYSARVGPDGSLTDLAPFASRGGEGVVAGPDGRVYVANGQVFVYAADGTPLGEIDVPERPLQLLFGGPDHRTLLILAHHALYSARP